MNKWVKRWNRLSSDDKVKYVCSAFKKPGGISKRHYRLLNLYG